MIKQGTRVAILVTMLWLLLPIDSAAQSLVAAVLPSSRSVQIGTTATAFATVINTGGTAATACGIAPLTSIPATFSFQATNPSTNQPIGIPNSPVNIPANTSQTFLLSITPTTSFAATEIQFSFACSNAPAATSIRGLNTLQLSATLTRVPDVVALAATLTNDGIANIDPDSRLGVFSVATVNVGTSGLITASADTGGANLSISVTICQTSPSTGNCLTPPGSTATTSINANATTTFGLFFQAQRPVPFDPAVNRIFIRFRDASGSVRGTTSVAVRDPASGSPASIPTDLAIYAITITGTTFSGSTSILLPTTTFTPLENFQRAGCLIVEPTIPPSNLNNGINPRDVGLFAGQLTAGEGGAIWFATNTTVFAQVGLGNLAQGLAAIDAAVVTANEPAGVLDIAPDGAFFGLPVARTSQLNSFISRTNPLLGLPRQIIQGAIRLQFSGDGQTVSGATSLIGTGFIEPGTFLHQSNIAGILVPECRF